MKAALLAVTALVTLLGRAEGVRPERLIDDKTSSAFPACSAGYSTQCSFNNVRRLVDAVASDLDATTDLSALLQSINNKEKNVNDGFGFSPYVFETTGMTCVANGRSTHFNGLTMAEIASNLTVVTMQEELSDEIRAAAEETSDGWIKFSFTSEDLPDEPVSSFGYVNKATVDGDDYIVMSAIARRTLPRMDVDTCPNSVNRRCSIQNVRSIIGSVLTRGMDVTTDADLRELWTEISYPIDDSFRDGPWYVFSYELNMPQRMTGHKKLQYVGMDHFNVTNSVVPVTFMNGTELHYIFADAALQGGGWATYLWQIGNQVELRPKVSFITGFTHNGIQYLAGAGFNHIRDPQTDASLCTACLASTAEPCAIGNVLSLSAHAEVELLTDIPSDVAFPKLTTDDEFRMPGGFGVTVVDYNGTVVADSLDESAVGTGVENALIARDIDDAQTTAIHDSLVALANQGGGWLELAGATGQPSFAAFVNKISKYGREYYLMNGYQAAAMSTEASCSAQYSAPCAETNVRALVGQVVTQLQLADTETEVQAILDDINLGDASAYFVGPDFYAIVLNEDFQLVAFGDVQTRGDWDMSVPDDYLLFVQQIQAVSTLGNEFTQDLRNAAFRVGGGNFTVTWNSAESSAFEERTIYVQPAKRKNAEGQELTYFVMSMYTMAAASPLCNTDDECPENAYCVEGDLGYDTRCTCGFYYSHVYNASTEEGDNTCAVTPTQTVMLSCVEDSEKAISNDIKAIAKALGSINVIYAACCMIWTLVMHKHAIVRASQPQLLALVALGITVSSGTIFAMSIDDSVGPPAADGANTRANTACMAQPWFYGLGFAITYCSMIVKLRRVAKVFKSAAALKKAKGVSLKETLAFLAGLLLVEVLIILVWTVVDPLNFERPEDDPLNGACKSPTASNYVVALAVYHLGLLFYGAKLSYRCRKVNGVFAEAKFLSLAMIGNLQVLLLALPVILLTADDSITSLFIRSIAVFLNDFSTTSLIFLPKMYFCVFGAPESSTIGIRTKRTGGGGTTVVSTHNDTVPQSSVLQGSVVPT
ncbi:Gamma-aminobutyric acid type B receptor subunit 1 [Hondaea fermentalgiana]|uniref:Gamma-aminobutyric acid type B receptor subunit 1 n=1 Tax=Hondaea fermentalgiana TaxID=2315210 RepID=A0A2R5GSI5_9STRA|nr:Gamma-aminobutyric acid type B receptor subunit 1 [Hondaea fermentalgiana]|eukprot:GBG33555.1 Gamma-aminobutyric acid type B receptor subunit 1 [Hondaea fermentalgiana]